jgi:hypothetical protein
MLVTDLLHRPVAARPRQHDRELLLRPAPVLPLLAQPRLLLGRAAHPEPAAGQSLRRYPPPNCSALQPSYLSTRDRGAGNSEHEPQQAAQGEVAQQPEQDHSSELVDGQSNLRTSQRLQPPNRVNAPHTIA